MLLWGRPQGLSIAGGTAVGFDGTATTMPTGPVAAPNACRFHGSAALDSAHVRRDAGRIANEVIAHLDGLVGASVRVRLEIETEIPSGARQLSSDEYVPIEGMLIGIWARQQYSLAALFVSAGA